jgi:hypothetical protein
MDIIANGKPYREATDYASTLANGSDEDNVRVADEIDDDTNVDDIGFSNLWKGHYGFA